MELNAGNWLIILIGILLCFTGILYKKVFEAILGFLIGAGTTLCALIVMALQEGATIFMVLGLLQTEEGQKVLLFAVICGVIVAVLSMVFERILAVIRAFCGAFLLACLFFIIAFADVAGAICLLLALVVAFLWAYLMWKYADYPFIIESALIGALMIYHVGYAEALSSTGSSSYYGSYGSDSSTSFSGYVILTVLTMVAGIYIQIMILKRLKARKGGKEERKGEGDRKNEKWDQYFSDSHIEKETAWNVRYYEKYLALIPILAFGICPFLWQLSGTQAFYQFLDYLQEFFIGAFAGVMIYFTIYYEKKVAFLYQLLYLSWFPANAYRAASNGYSLFASYGAELILKKTVVFMLVWGILVLVDHLIKNVKLKIGALFVAAGFMLAWGIEWFTYDYWYFQISEDILCNWVGIGVVLALLVKARKQPVGRRCMKCGTMRITGDYFCRNCGAACIDGKTKQSGERIHGIEPEKAK